jgi:acetolactate synthase-1/2/3 large subunit
VQERVSLTIVVFNDSAYGTIKADQSYRHPGRSIGNDLRSPDFVRYAEAFGIRGCRVDSVSKVPELVAKAVDQPLTTLIEAPCPQVLPPWIETEDR